MPIVTPVSASSIGSGTVPRRTLTDADRRSMCVYHEENPTLKQTEIGGEYSQVLHKGYANHAIAVYGVDRRFVTYNLGKALY